MYYSRFNLGVGPVVNEVVFHSHVSMCGGCTIGGRAGNRGRKDCFGLCGRVESVGRCVRIEVFKEGQTILNSLEVIEDPVERVFVKVAPIFKAGNAIFDSGEDVVLNSLLRQYLVLKGIMMCKPWIRLKATWGG